MATRVMRIVAVQVVLGDDPDRRPDPGFRVQAFLQRNEARPPFGSLERSSACGVILATGLPFLVTTMVSPRSAAAITCEKFWSRPAR